MKQQNNVDNAIKKKAFEECQLEIITFDCKDVITASTLSDDFVGIPSIWNIGKTGGDK